MSTNQLHQPAAFPRGKRKQASTPDASSSSSSKPKAKDGGQPSKKRFADAASSSASTAAPEKDFLFGNDNLDNVVQKKSHNKHPRVDTDHDAELLEIQQRQLLTVSSSQLPLGGGAVLPPTQTSNGKRRIPPRIESLTFSKFARGTKVLGVIREVADEYAVISLPTMLTGFVRRGSSEQNIRNTGKSKGGSSPPLTRVLPAVNTVMAFYVLSTTTTEHEVSKKERKSTTTTTTPAQVKKRRIELSPWPVHVNTGVRVDEYLSPKTSSSTSSSVGTGSSSSSMMVARGRIVSVEDHGCIVDLGGILHNGQCAFLQFDNVEGDYEIIDDTEDGDDEADDNDDDEVKEKMDDIGSTDSSSPPCTRKLNPNRIYDFTILPTNITSSNNNSTSSNSASSASRTILQLGLPSPSTLARLRTTSSMMPSLSSLQPGMLTEVHVEAHAKNGICVSFNNGVYRGSIDEDHLGGHRGVEEGGKSKRISSTEKGNNDGDGGSNDPNMWWKGVFKGKHAKFTARIIAADAATKIVRFSLNANILALNGEYTSLFPHAVGTIIKNAQVIRVDPGIGALLALPPPSSSSTDIESNTDTDAIMKEHRRQEIIQRIDKDLANNLLTNTVYNSASKVSTAYVHISKSMDNEIKPSKKGQKQHGNDNNNQPNRTPDALFARHFSMNTRVKSLRILSTTNLFDGIASCATAKSIVEAHVLTHADIQPGKIYKDVPVMQLLESGGVLVNLGVGTKGLIPAIHLFDKASHGSIDTAGGDGILSGYRSKIRQAKYKVGNLISVRCLTVDVATRQCVLTAKKTLLANDTTDPIVNYPSITPGKIAAGFVSKVDDSGLTVTFYNNVHGRVSSRSLAAELGVEDPKVNYSVGDVVAARVVDCIRRRNRHASASYHNHDENENEKIDMYYYHLNLSLKTTVENTKEREESEKSVLDEGKADDGSSVAVPLAAGSILMPKRMKVLQLVNCLRRDDGIVLPGYAVVSIKSKFFTGVLPNAGDAVECKLPYEQLLDSFDGASIELDDVAQKKLTVGKRIDAEGFLLSMPAEVDALPVVSLRPLIIDTIKSNVPSASSSSLSSDKDDLSIICPSPRSNIFMGEYVRGYVTRIDNRFGAFVRFLDGLTGLIPKLKKGLDEKLYETILCKVTALDVTAFPPKILLKRVSESEIVKKRKKIQAKNVGTKGVGQLKVGEVVGDVKVVDINFARAKVVLLDNHSVRARIHVTMADSLTNRTKLSKTEKQLKEELKIGKSHPFYSWKVGDVISGVRCVALDIREETTYVELSNMTATLPCVVTDPAHLPPGSILSTIVTSVSTNLSSHHGLWVQVCPGISGFIPALELSTDADVLNDISSHYAVGSRLTCCVIDGVNNTKKPPLLYRRHQIQADDHDDEPKEEHNAVELSVLLVPGDSNEQSVFKPTKPHRGDIVVGRINNKARMIAPPALMLNLRGNVVGRCCVTELADVVDWENMPLGKVRSPADDKATSGGKHHHRVVSSDSEPDHPHDEDGDDSSDHATEESGLMQNDYPDGKYVQCRVLGGPAKAKGMVELSLRDSRLGGNMEDDRIPNANEIVNAYVVSTTKQGCFLRLSRSIEGRVILKELSDDFIPNPSAIFPPGRLIVGKIKHIKESQDTKKCTMVDVDMRESVLLASGDRLTIDDIEENSKYTGVITRVESYGVFVRIDNSDVSGLAHVSECSDTYIKNIHDLYNPGDFVKLIVISMDKEQRRLAFSLKASNFVDDDDSDDTSSTSSDEMEEDSDSGDDDTDEDSIDSEDEAFASKLAKKMVTEGDGMELDDEETDDFDDNSDDGSSSDSESSDGEDDESKEGQNVRTETLSAMDTDVGFDWGASSSKPAKSSLTPESSDDDESSSSESSEDESDDADSGFKSSHKARKKAAAKKREEEETSRREAALADGTADETPETPVDFERLIASNPNSSEVWIKYMAFHLSLADIDSARNVASQAFKRIEFREEGEKLNVWTALLTLELKFGTDKSLQETVDNACKQNNPKHVYLRVCELLDKEVDAAASAIGSADLETSSNRADEMFKKMCKKFKSKKSVWLAYSRYLLKSSRHEEAHALLKKSLQSLSPHKQVEVMSKYAQMEFQLGSPERGRTIFNALLEKHPKRMDLLFVHIDKEVKNGDISKARALFESVVNPVSSDRKFKFSSKQMKSLFKKWYRLEEEHGNEETQDHVKEEARAFVAKSNP